MNTAMRVRERDIPHSAGPYWVLRRSDGHYVMRDGITHAQSDSAYPANADGLSLAVARCDYLAIRLLLSSSGERP